MEEIKTVCFICKSDIKKPGKGICNTCEKMFFLWSVESLGRNPEVASPSRRHKILLIFFIGGKALPPPSAGYTTLPPYLSVAPVSFRKFLIKTDSSDV